MKAVDYSLTTFKGAAWIAISILLLCIAYYLLEWNNERAQMADFRVYYDAANAITQGDVVYAKAFGVSSGFYKYSPLAAWLFVVLGWLPYSLASVIYYMLIALAVTLSGFLFVRREAVAQKSKPSDASWALVLSFVFMADHIERELHLGNVNLFILLLAFVMFRMIGGKPFLAGLIYAVMLLFKPHFLILLPYLIWKKRWHTVAASVIGIGVGVLLPALFSGWEKNLELHSQWLQAMQDHNVTLYQSPNTIYGIVHSLLGSWSASSLLPLMILAITAILFLFFMLRNKRMNRGNEESSRFIEFFLLIALIPNLTHTDTEHFMWTWPLIAFVIVRLVTSKFSTVWNYAILMILAFVPYCLNSPDIVGKDLRLLFDEGGLLGLANLIIIGCALALHIKTGEGNAVTI